MKTKQQWLDEIRDHLEPSLERHGFTYEDEPFFSTMLDEIVESIPSGGLTSAHDIDTYTYKNIQEWKQQFLSNNK